MITNLQILNGEISLPFDSLNTIYTVRTEQDFLDFKYDLAPNAEVSIFGNDYLTNGENIVVLTVFNDVDTISYYFYVYKMEEIVASTDDSRGSLLNFISTKKEVPAYLGPTIGVICFLSILFLFVILFKKDKKY